VPRHGPAQHIRLPGGELPHGHGDTDHLLLKYHYAERLLEDWLEQRVRVRHLLQSQSPLEEGVDHVPLQRPRADQGDFYDNVAEDPGLHLDQGLLLRP